MPTIDDVIKELDGIMQFYEDHVAANPEQAGATAQQLGNYIHNDNFPTNFIGAILKKGVLGLTYLNKLFKFFKTVHDKDPDQAPTILQLLQIFFSNPYNAINLLKYDMLTATGFEEFLAQITNVHADGRKEALMQILTDMPDNRPDEKIRKIEWLSNVVDGNNDLHRFFACQRGWSKVDKDSGTLGAVKKELEQVQSMVIIAYDNSHYAYRLAQKDAACQFICDIANLDERIKFLTDALTEGTDLNVFFSLQRGLTPASEFSGTLYKLKIALHAARKEKFSQQSKQKLQDFKQQYNDNADTAVKIIEDIKRSKVMLQLVVNEDYQIKGYIEFLQQLVTKNNDDAVSEAVLALLQQTFTVTAGGRSFSSVDLADTIVSFFPEAFVWYRNCLMTLINKRERDVDFFGKVMNLLTRTGVTSRKTFIARILGIYDELLLKFSQQNSCAGDHLVIVSVDQISPHITGVDSILERYVALIAELFANMPVEYRENDVIKKSFMQLWSDECVMIFHHINMYDDSLFTLLENDFFTYIKRPDDIDTILGVDMLYKSTLVGHLFKKVDKFEDDADKIALLEQALNRDTNLGAAVWLQQGLRKCDWGRGKVKEIAAKLNEVKGLPVNEEYQFLIYIGSLFGITRQPPEVVIELENMNKEPTP